MTLVKKYLAKHQAMMQRYTYLDSMYEGFHSIYLAPEKPNWKPDNRLAFNYPRYWRLRNQTGNRTTAWHSTIPDT